MALVVGTNSYVTVAEADTYFGDRFGADDWLALTEEVKEQLLISAMPLLETYCDWSGEKTDDEQVLEFPRNGDTVVPQAIKNGQCELALAVNTAGGVTSSSSANLKVLKADTVQMEWMDNITKVQPYYNDYVISFLKGYCSSVGNGTARVLRT